MTTTEVPTSPAPMTCSTIAIADLRDPPWQNPRAKITPESVQDLAHTIERHGLLQPVVVMPALDGTKGFYLLAGYRRVAALKLLGRTHGPAHVMERWPDVGAAELARQVSIIENGQRLALDPVRESEVVCLLLDRPNATQESVAADLGQSPTWVARRARLRSLSKGMRAARAKAPVNDWPGTWLEDVALLRTLDQDALAQSVSRDAGAIANHRVLVALVRERLAQLGSAPWDLKDANLVPKAGACVGCKKHTAAEKGLFDGDSPTEIKAARCLDHTCFEAKRAAWTSAAKTRAREKHGAELIEVRGAKLGDFASRKRLDMMDSECRVRDDAQDLCADLDQTVGYRAPAKDAPKSLREFQTVKKDTKGATPALVVDGEGAGKVVYVKPLPAGQRAHPSSATTGRQKDPIKPKSMAEKKAALAKRRQKHVLCAVEEQLDKWIDDAAKIPAEIVKSAADEPQWVLDLVAAFGCEEGERGWIPAKDRLNEKRTAELLEGGGFKYDKNAGLLPRILASFKKTKMEGLRYARTLTEHFEWARQLYCLGLGLDNEWKALGAVAEAEIPTPRAWGAPTPEKPAKKANGKKTIKKLERQLKGLQSKASPKKKRATGKAAAAGDFDGDGEDE